MTENLHKMVNGEKVFLTDEEIAFRNAEIARDEAEQITNEIKRSIIALESQITPRRMREALLGNLTWLQAQEVLINQQRSRL